MKTQNRTLNLVLVTLLAVIPAACGGGSGSGSPNADAGGDDGQEPSVPEASIVFPPPLSRTDAHEITVRGSASYAEQIQSMSVNGLAVSTLDGYQTWTCLVPLVEGKTELSLEIKTAGGEVIAGADTALVRRTDVLLGDPIDVILTDSPTPTAYYLMHDRVLSHDLLTGEVQIMTGPEHGAGPLFEEPVAIEIDASGELLFVLDRGQDERVIGVKIASGTRFQLNDPSAEDQPQLSGITDMCYLVAADAGGVMEILFFSSRENASIYYMNCGTGETSIGEIEDAPFDGLEALAVRFDPFNPEGAYLALLDQGQRLFIQPLDGDDLVQVATPGDGQGDIWSQATDMEILADGTLLVADRHSGHIYTVDPVTFERSTLSEQFDTEGFEFQDIAALASRELFGSQVVLAADRGLDIVAGIDLDEGEWGAMLDHGVGDGVSVNFGFGLTRVEDDFLVTSLLPGDVVSVELETSQRTSLVNWGELAFQHAPTDVCFDEAKGLAYFADAVQGSIEALVLSTGEVMTISGNGVGSGPQLENVVYDLVWDSTARLILVLSEDALMQVDPSTGERSFLSGPGQDGGGIPLEDARALILDPLQGRAVVCCEEFLASVELSTGQRQILSGSGVGAGPELSVARGLVYSSALGEFVVLNEDGSTVLRVSESDGRREPLFLADVVSGPGLEWGTRLHLDEQASVLYVLDGRQGALKVLDLEGAQWVDLSR